MTDLARTLAALMVGLPLLAVPVLRVARTSRRSDVIAQAVAILTAIPALTLAALALVHGRGPLVDGSWLLVDRASALLLAVTGAVGVSSVLLSRVYLRADGRSWMGTHSHSSYYTALFLFWAASLAVPLSGNLAITWLIVEATTAASALLVSFSGRREALEAGWKYLILTTLGLSVALLGIIAIAIAQGADGHHGLSALDWHALRAAAPFLRGNTVLVGFVLLVVGLAAKIGWAPVHNWLPDAHSEAPAPISALLSAALLPTVLLVAWRAKSALGPAVDARTSGWVFISFGLASIAVAIPFLWKTMPWKRFLAYSSLEHMGVVGVGIGFGSRLALTGVVIHVAGHAFAKSLGFYAALGQRQAVMDSGGEPAGAGAADSAPVATAKAISLVALAGLPPSPLFISELLIVLGGIRAGFAVPAALTAAALALAFLGLLHALLEGILGERGARQASVAGELA